MKCPNHWSPFLKVLNQEAFFCRPTYMCITNTTHQGIVHLPSCRAVGENCSAVISIAQLYRDHSVSCLEKNGEQNETFQGLNQEDSGRYSDIAEGLTLALFVLLLEQSKQTTTKKTTNQTSLLQVCKSRTLLNSLLMTFHQDRWEDCREEVQQTPVAALPTKMQEQQNTFTFAGFHDSQAERQCQSQEQPQQISSATQFMSSKEGCLGILQSLV